MKGSMADLPKTTDEKEITIRETKWGGMHVAMIVCHETLDMAPAFKGLPGDRCPVPHWGMILKGRKLVRYADHEEVLNTGDSYYMAPGHTTVTDAGTEWLEFSPEDEMAATGEVVARNLSELRKE